MKSPDRAMSAAPLGCARSAADRPPPCAAGSSPSAPGRCPTAPAGAGRASAPPPRHAPRSGPRHVVRMEVV
jgi:hypothetical protein